MQGFPQPFPALLIRFFGKLSSPASLSLEQQPLHHFGRSRQREIHSKRCSVLKGTGKRSPSPKRLGRLFYIRKRKYIRHYLKYYKLLYISKLTILCLLIQTARNGFVSLPKRWTPRKASLRTRRDKELKK